MMIPMATHKASSSTSRPTGTYDVFLSFRGMDTRKNFTDHLYTALVQAGYHTFRDDDEIERGNKIESELRKAIKQSRISIIIFSKNYASSSWCLTELSKIVESKKSSKHEILPIFYDVTPSQVRKQTGSFGEAFDKHEKRSNVGNEENMVERWRSALEEVADLAGMELKNEADGHESKFVQKILKLVGNKLKSTALTVVPYAVGTDSNVRGISFSIATSTDIILAICGIDGIGKTTIAKLVFNKNIEKFEAGSFLENIRQTIDGPSGLIQLQKQLLSDIGEGKEAKIQSVDEGFSEIKCVLSRIKVLLVLDDVNTIEHLYALVGMGDWLYPGSKIIVTTTNEHLGEKWKMEMHKIDKLLDDDSLRLFCLHAFRKDHPADGYKELASDMAGLCRGVPLALEILGSSLFGNRFDEWKRKLKQLNNNVNSQNVDILRVSLDSLTDSHDKQLFLDIAFFFVGKDKDHSVRALEDCGFSPVPGIQNLEDKRLIRIDQDNKLVMHQLVRDMAKKSISQALDNQVGPYRDELNLLRKYTLIFFGIICVLLFIFIVFPSLFEAIGLKYICPIFNTGKDRWKCGDLEQFFTTMGNAAQHMNEDSDRLYKYTTWDTFGNAAQHMNEDSNPLYKFPTWPLRGKMADGPVAWDTFGNAAQHMNEDSDPLFKYTTWDETIGPVMDSTGPSGAMGSGPLVYLSLFYCIIFYFLF